MRSARQAVDVATEGAKQVVDFAEQAVDVAAEGIAEGAKQVVDFADQRTSEIKRNARRLTVNVVWRTPAA